jgi:hypothetical protein
VDKQKACYRNTPGSDQKVNSGPPAWLDARFLYRINFGPGTIADRDLARKACDPATRGTPRRSITLLDRDMAQLLHRAIFSNSRVKPVNWNDTEAATDASRAGQQGSCMPFDYPLSDEMDALIAFEDYMVSTVWSTRYSTMLLKGTRPPMTAVARDIITLVNSLKGLGNMDVPASTRPLQDVLSKF